MLLLLLLFLVDVLLFLVVGMLMLPAVLTVVALVVAMVAVLTTVALAPVLAAVGSSRVELVEGLVWGVACRRLRLLRMASLTVFRVVPRRRLMLLRMAPRTVSRVVRRLVPRAVSPRVELRWAWAAFQCRGSG